MFVGAQRTIQPCVDFAIFTVAGYSQVCPPASFQVYMTSMSALSAVVRA